MNLAAELQSIEPQARDSPWDGHEHARGYGVMVLPFSSGHLLGLRVFPDNTFAPYRSVWHRTPDGAWSIYNDGHSLDTTCPRWWKPALEHAGLTDIELSWTGPNDLRVSMEEPDLEWNMSISASAPVRALNRLNAAQPSWLWRSEWFRSAEAAMARRIFGMGELQFSFETPTGMQAAVMPEQVFFISSSEARFKGEDLGHPVRLKENPTIGDVPLPKRPTFFTGAAYAQIEDANEFRETRADAHSHSREPATA